MRRTILTSAALALLLLLGGIAVAGAAPVTEAKGGDGGARTLRFEVRFSPFQLIDVGDPGPGVGDYVVFHDQLLSGGKKVGDEGGSCPIVDAGEGLIHCTGTVRLAGGQIAFQGLTTSARPSSSPSPAAPAASRASAARPPWSRTATAPAASPSGCAASPNAG